MLNVKTLKEIKAKLLELGDSETLDTSTVIYILEKVESEIQYVEETKGPLIQALNCE